MFKNKWFFLTLSTLVAILYVFLRVYKIDTSLLFFNDMGRDFLELWEWRQTKIPPLLGPQTSALSFNQSPFYFYLFFPIFILSRASPYTTVITLNLCYGLVFLLGVWYCYHHHAYRQRFLLTGFYITIAPELVVQNRNIWNPSFIPLLLCLALFFYPETLLKITPKRLHLFAASLTLAVSFNYSVFPVFVASIVYGLFYWRRQAWKILLALLAYGLFWYLPVIFFEFRHQFTLTYLFFHGQRLGFQSVPLTAKIISISRYLFLNYHFGIFIILLITLFVMLSLRKQALNHRQCLIHYSAVGLISLLLTLLSPSVIHSHYIFGLMTVLAFIIASLRLRYALVLLFLTSAFWLHPNHVQTYFNPAVRTIAQLQACYKAFCASYPQPLYVSAQAGFHPYHNAPEHRYLMKQSGCEVMNIEQNQNQSPYMAVVVDDSTYTHGQTAYNELTLFGQSKEKDIYTCRDNLKIHVLERIP